jgi:aspartate--ammonia ligase
MNAIRKDEELDNIHSIYVDQWDWELMIDKSDRNMETLKDVVTKIYKVFKETEEHIHQIYPEMKRVLPEKITFITSQELLDMYPELTPKQREDKIVKDKGAVFLTQIGKELTSGEKHDGRSPDYDDWDLNGDILFYNPILDNAVELSSMGIRVDEESLDRQLRVSGCDDRRSLDYHKALLNGELPYTIGGGIGQSRICMYFLNKAHIGEVQVGIWPQDMVENCSEAGVHLL